MHFYPQLPLAEKCRELSALEDLLSNSGYSLLQIRDIMVSGLMSLERKKSKSAKLGQPIRRSVRVSARSSEHKKLVGKSSWFKG